MFLLKKINSPEFQFEGIHVSLQSILKLIIRHTSETLWQEIFRNTYDRNNFELLRANTIICKNFEIEYKLHWFFIFLETEEGLGIFQDDYNYSNLTKEKLMYELEILYGGVICGFVLNWEECARLDKSAIETQVRGYIDAIVSR